MAKKLKYLLIILTGSILCFLPLGGARSRAQSQEAVRVISLAGIGSDQANSVVFSQDGKQLTVGATAGVYLFDAQTLSQIKFIQTGTWVRSLAISPDGEALAAGLFDGTARLWRLYDLEPLRTFAEHGSWVRSVAFTPDGKLLATASDDNTVRLWNNEDGSLQLKIENIQGVRSLAVSPDGEIIAVGLQDNTIQLRSLPEGTLLSTLVGHKGWVRCLAFSPDGRLLASGAFDATAHIWDVASGQSVNTLSGHKSSVLGIAFSPDGTTLATGSVDKTVRLWKVNDGSLIRALVGHDNFVYSVAFSPDGGTLASGAGDNTVRLWDLSSASDDSIDLPETPSDCRACHHPTTSNSAPAVVVVRCEACHPGGAGLNWCPNFPRSTSKVNGVDTHTISSIHTAGVPVRGESIQVKIFSPANGESLYSYPDYVAPVTVTGKVESDQASLAGVEVRLQVWAGSEMIASLTRTPDPNGLFTFLLGVNSNGYMLRINNLAALYNCYACHDDFVPQAYLPSGDIHLDVEATTEEGAQARDERWIISDISSNNHIRVAISDSQSGKAVERLTIHAFTRLYEWRGRVASATSDVNGMASLNLETLSQASTAYEISIPDQVVDGVYYSSQQTRTIVIKPGATNEPPISIGVDAERGQINGILGNTGNLADGSIPIWAFRLPAGPSFRMDSTKEGLFLFKDLPVSEYLVFADPPALDSYSLAGNQQVVDLTKEPSSNVEITLSPLNGVSASGIIEDIEGKWIPFAWFTAPDGSIHPTDLKSGEWRFNDVPLNGQNWVVSAPGYYSQELIISNDQPASKPSISLQRLPDTDIIKWGDGEVIIPDETIANITENHIGLENGWVWGEGSNRSPVVLSTTEAEITLLSGQFALERLSGNVSWFYLFMGQAEVRSQSTGQIITLKAGDMVALLKQYQLTAIPYEPEIVSALRLTEGVTISPVWKPSQADQFWDRAAGLGINAAQIVTFITYFIAVPSVIIVPWLLIRRRLKRHKFPGGKNE